MASSRVTARAVLLLGSASWTCSWCAAAEALAAFECRALDGSAQACEDYTYAGSLVEALPSQAQLEEALSVEVDMRQVSGPDASLEGCELRLREWLLSAAEYYETGVYKPEVIIPTQNYIMGNHDQVVQLCPAAWLATLLLKIESNLERGRAGLTCARVHSAGCLRDARGYWKGFYASARAELAGTGLAHLEVTSLLAAGEARVAASFRVSLQEGLFVLPAAPAAPPAAPPAAGEL